MQNKAKKKCQAYIYIKIDQSTTPSPPLPNGALAKIKVFIIIIIIGKQIEVAWRDWKQVSFSPFIHWNCRINTQKCLNNNVSMKRGGKSITSWSYCQKALLSAELAQLQKSILVPDYPVGCLSAFNVIIKLFIYLRAVSWK